ncbi:replication protein C (RepC) [mine drainage metagenome]|uniref:Replication protein C (RepC) n=1 Tax=mine drainage metagenome TaxID=410659 RepID=A0A1J5PSK8_9ZZZZ
MKPQATTRIVRLDQSVGLSTLFRPLPKAKVRPTLDVEYRPKNGGLTLRFSAREALGMPEQSLLLTLLELAQEQYEGYRRDVVVIDRHAQGIGLDLWRAIHDGQVAADGETLHIRTSWHELAGRCGTHGGRSQQLREEQLRRLCEVAVWEKANDTLRSFRQSRLVTVVQGNDLRLHLAVNCRLAGAAMGVVLYAQVSLAERQALSTDTTQATHAFLSTTLRPGRSMRIGVATLMQRLWSDLPGSVPEGTLRARSKAVRDALDAVGTLNAWSVTWPRAGVAEIRRKRRGVQPSTQMGTRPGLASRPQDEPCAVSATTEYFDATRFLVPSAVAQSAPLPTVSDMDFRQRTEVDVHIEDCGCEVSQEADAS